jgi:hypothetical protein
MAGLIKKLLLLLSVLQQDIKMKTFFLPELSREKIIALVMMVVIFAMVGVGVHLYERRPPAPVFQVSDVGITLLGRGNVPPLHQARGADRLLNGLLDEFGTITPVEYFANSLRVNQAVVEILFRWTGADMVSPGHYGPHIDSRIVAFLIAMNAAPATIRAGTQIQPDQVAEIEALWFRIYDHYRIRLLTQFGGAVMYEGKVKYNLPADRLDIDGTLSPAFVANFQAALRHSNRSGEVIRAFLDYVDRTKGFENLNEAEQNLIMSLRPE